MAIYLVKSEKMTFVEANSEDEARDIYDELNMAQCEEVTEVKESSTKEMYDIMIS